jgi:peptidoglycan/LPS O-acetylase OafA/YrhL
VTVRRLLVRLVAAMLCLTAAVAIVVLLGGRFDETTDRILLTTTTVSFFSLLGVPAASLLEQGRAPILARASAALTAAGFLFTLVVIWGHDHARSTWQAWGVLMTLALGAAQAATVEGRRRPTDSETVARLAVASMATGTLLAALGVFAIVTERSGEGFYRALGALLVLDVLLVALQAVLRRGSGPTTSTFRLQIDGRAVDATGRDFAAAVAQAIRDAERTGEPVRRIERIR